MLAHRQSAAVWVIAACLVATFLSRPAFGEADYVREKRWADEVVPAIVVGDAVWLEAAGRKFLGIYTAPPKARAGVVIVHGMGVHPDWGLINPLRSGLTEQGYATLSVQMPVLAADATPEQYPSVYPEAAARLKSAVAFLRGKGMAKVAIAGHSLGARMADFYLNRASDTEVEAWIAIGMPGDFGNMRIRVLDIFGEADFPALLQTAEKRVSALRKGRGSAQVQVAGADHFFNGREAELVKHVKLFLDRALK
jgi:predicted alpha/beta-fold hydrolase